MSIFCIICRCIWGWLSTLPFDFLFHSCSPFPLSLISTFFLPCVFFSSVLLLVTVLKNVLVFNGYYSIMPVMSRNHRIHSNRAQIQSKNLLHHFSKISYQLFRFWKETKSCFLSTDKRSEPIMSFKLSHYQNHLGFLLIVHILISHSKPYESVSSLNFTENQHFP